MSYYNKSSIAFNAFFSVFFDYEPFISFKSKVFIQNCFVVLMNEVD